MDDDNFVDLPETAEEIAAREARLSSPRKRKPVAEAERVEGERLRKYNEHVAVEAAEAAGVQARVDAAQAELVASATPQPVAPDPEQERLKAETIAAEKAEAERVRDLGPEPSMVTTAQVAANPSDYLPGIEENRRRALEPTEDEQAHSQQAAVARQAMINEEHGGVAVERARPAVAPAPVAAVDTRQLWVCVGVDGIRSMTHGDIHPAFRSDAHMLGEMVRCPTCGETTVRKVDPNEDLRLDEERSVWANMPPHQRELVMAQRRATRNEGGALTAPR
jgi:hypothetical protein